MQKSSEGPIRAQSWADALVKIMADTHMPAACRLPASPKLVGRSAADSSMTRLD